MSAKKKKRTDKFAEALSAAFNKHARPNLIQPHNKKPNQRLATHRRIWSLEHRDGDYW